MLKFLHTMGAIGLMGALGCLLVLMSFTSALTSPAGYGLMFNAMFKITSWIFMPSMVLTLIAGLLAIAVNPVYHEAGWAWIKAAMGILIFEGGLHALGPIQERKPSAAPARLRPR